MGPYNIPNSVIYLLSVIRPNQLRPHLRVPSIANVDFSALRRMGFNAVVIDKDNCLTLPHSDELYGPLLPAWKTLLSSFDPGRVLIVSNSSGTRKDSGGIGALSISLRAPVLLHHKSKPGCASDIISYFTSTLGTPQSLRTPLALRAQEEDRNEQEEEDALLDKWRGDVESGSLLGHSTGSRDALRGEGENLQKKMVKRQKETAPKIEPSTQTKPPTRESSPSRDEQRIVVIGDRLFTDTLLSHRLSLHLRKSFPSPTNPSQAIPSVISIHTSNLPQPRDVRLLRWVEDKLSSYRIKRGSIDWGRYVREDSSPLNDTTSNPRVKANWRWSLFWRRGPEQSQVTWDPRTWKPMSIAMHIGRSLGRVAGTTRIKIVELIKSRSAARKNVGVIAKTSKPGNDSL